MELFRPERIVDVAQMPEFFCHGPRKMELLPCDMVRMTCCRDEPTQISGLAPMSIPVLAITLPVPAMLWNFQAIAQWAHQHNLLRLRPIGPVRLRPERTLMM